MELAIGQPVPRHGPAAARNIRRHAKKVSLLCFCCFDSLLTQLYFSFINCGTGGRGGGCATTTTAPSPSIVLLLLLIIVLRLLVLLVLLLLVLLVLLLLTGKNEYVMYYVYFNSRFLLL